MLRNRLLPRWGNRVALSLEPLEIEQWLEALKRKEELSNPTLDRMRRDSSNSGVEPDALCPLQDHQRLRSHDPYP